MRQRLARDGHPEDTRPLHQLFAQITTLLAERIAPWIETRLASFASEVVALDEVTLDRVARLLPARRKPRLGCHCR